MQIALVNGLRSEAIRGFAGVCQACNSPMIAKCGPRRAWHWAHKGLRRCDPWWEETKWHLGWKSRFPADWQEVLQRAEDGEKHIADVKTPDGRVIEFQHSRLKDEERRAREAFYKSMIWVVDGLARKRDLPSFENTLRGMIANPLVYSGWKECALLRDWVGRPVDVFFDFGKSLLWHLHPSPEGGVILTSVPVAEFIEKLHKGISFERVHFKHPDVPTPVVPARYQQYWPRIQRRRFHRL